MVYIRLSTSICCLFEHRMGKGNILVIHNRVKATDKDNAFFVIQLSYFIRCK